MVHGVLDVIEDLLDLQIKQPIRCISLSALLPVVEIQLNMFRASHCPSSGAYKLQ